MNVNYKTFLIEEISITEKEAISILFDFLNENEELDAINKIRLEEIVNDFQGEEKIEDESQNENQIEDESQNESQNENQIEDESQNEKIESQNQIEDESQNEI